MKASGWWRGGILVWGVLFLAACSENVDLFSSLDDPAEPQLSTVQVGSVITEDQTLEVQIEYPSDEASRATSMRVELRDMEGMVHGTAEFDQTQLAEPVLPSVQFTEIPEGVYVLVTEAWINDQPLVSDQRQIFVTSFPPRIESVTIHPTSIRREMQALAVADLDHGVSTRPYLRWIFDGEVAAEGYLADGLDRAILDGAGRSAGAYRVSLEVYPWGVDEGTVIDGSTTIIADSDVVVREELQPGPPDFAQRSEGTVVRYFSFDGTGQAWSDSAEESLEATVEGDVYLDLISGALGVRVAPAGTVTVPLPAPERSDVAHLVELRVSSTGAHGAPGAVESSSDDPLIYFAGSQTFGEQVAIHLEDGTFLMSPPGAHAIPLVTAPDERELVTLRVLLRNVDGDILLEPAMNGAGAMPRTTMGSGIQDLSVTLQGQGDRQIFLDRITVTELTDAQLHQGVVDRATGQFLQSFNQELSRWAIGLPDESSDLPTVPDDYSNPQDSLRIAATNSSFLNLLLPDNGALVFRDEEGETDAITLTRRGPALELSSAATGEQVLSSLDVSDASGPFTLHRLQLRPSSVTTDGGSVVQLGRGEDERGEFITVYLPETYETAPVVAVPDSEQARYPVWVGRWVQ